MCETFLTLSKGKGPVIVVQSHPVHGSLLYRNTFKPLEDFAQVIYFDSRNTGKSLSQNETIKCKNFIDDVELLRITLQLPRFTLIGHSFGGNIALKYAESNYSNLYSVILISTVNKLKEHQEILLKSHSLHQGKTNALLAKQEKPQISHKNAQYLAKHEEQFEVTKHNLPLSGYLFYGSEELYSEIDDNISTLFEKFAQKEMPMCGHFSWLEKPEMFFNTIENFIKQL